MQALYAFKVGGDEAKHVIDTIINPGLVDPEIRAFSVRLFLKTLGMEGEADDMVERYAQNWELSRIALVDRILLRMAICEMVHFEDIPPKVSINEAIDIAKRYSTERSGQFINGILDAILLDLNKEGKLNKSGRGLVGLDTLRKQSNS